VFSLKAKEIKEWILLIASAVVIAVVLRIFVIEPRYVPTPSMVPTIMVDDKLYVEKLSVRFGELRRGMIVIFKDPETTGSQDYLVKRLIGLGGDSIKISEGQLWVNDQAVDEPYLNEPMKSDFPEVTVPEGQVFLMGDNRNHSQDSRSWGTVDEDCISGQALFIYYPVSHWGSLWGQRMKFK
jgi:signal peptidase I